MLCPCLSPRGWSRELTLLSRPASARLFSTSRVNFVYTHSGFHSFSRFLREIYIASWLTPRLSTTVRKGRLKSKVNPGIHEVITEYVGKSIENLNFKFRISHFELLGVLIVSSPRLLSLSFTSYCEVEHS